jgi:NAD(P)-dependent dehydrogenase (short-subunit alcohol dehydrogenase family)
MSDTQPKVAIVTGGACGIGRATCLAFAEIGVHVAVVDVLEAEGRQTVGEIEAAGGRAIFIRCDVSDEAQVAAMVARTVAELGGLDYAFNNAGVEGDPAPTAEATRDNWDRTLAINLTGVWLCMQHELAHMVPAGAGVIVNCASIAGLVGFPGLGAYVASKHGVIGLTKAAALEYAQAGVRVNVVCPGVIQTPMIERFVADNDEARAGLTAGTPMGRIGRPEEIASAVVWLCSPGAAFTTGAELAIDGGWVAR